MVRQVIPEWKELSQDQSFNEKVQVLELDNFDDLETKLENHQISLSDHSVFLCALGTRVKVGEELFVKVDYQYPLDFARFAVKSGAQYYGIISSIGANANSPFLYMRTKGRVEQDIKQITMPKMAIYKPGLLCNRDNDFRLGEWLLKGVPFVKKIESKDLATAILNHAAQSLSDDS